MFCAKCGGEVPEGGQFCARCGARVGAPVAQSVPAAAPSSVAIPATVPPAAFPGMPLLSADQVLVRPTGISILAILDYVGGALYSLAGLSLMVFGSMNKEQAAGMMLAGFLLLALGALAIVCGWGLWTLKPWGRTVQLVFSWIGLLGFPLGTIISIIVLMYLYKPQLKLLFSGKTPAELTGEDVAMLSQFVQSGGGGAGLLIAVVGIFVVFIAVIGIVAAIAIPNLLNAIQRGKQKRTMADMRAIATACEMYAIDNAVYPDAKSMDDLARLVEPTYIKQLPRTDAWMNPMRYGAWIVSEDAKGPDAYVVVSGGKDGALEHENLQGYSGAPTTNFNADIAFSNGSFVQYPEGVQH